MNSLPAASRLALVGWPCWTPFPFLPHLVVRVIWIFSNRLRNHCSQESSSMPGKKPSSRMLSEHVRTPCLIRRTPSVLRRCGFAVTLSCRSGVICLAFVGLCIHEHDDYRCLLQHCVMRVVVLVDSFGHRKFCVYLQSAWSVKYSVSLELSDDLRGS